MSKLNKRLIIIKSKIENRNISAIKELSINSLYSASKILLYCLLITITNKNIASQLQKSRVLAKQNITNSLYSIAKHLNIA